ncbi:RNA polymerase sigma factor [Arthrobacter sp. AL08]|uniref:RNA polymerase sigma factor n=1 Tax=unclassified Arthrobacter TaxID=235627 RepID=UPI00249B2B0F|nr:MULTISPECIES: RNA polymerase sigma factor [unclassified Arthrobacter]MDI3243345.1 RNA polymerase sigma factor [Arthrobacter sp. AL05]MDI3279349.1 RNA polymerase sigma factor [Arthrobacter sp. AL08]
MSAATARKDALAEASDGLLARRAGDGDMEAFEGLARRYGTMMRAYARRVLGSTTDVDDVVQEALIQAWNQIDGLRDASAVRPWLLRITGNRALDVLRRRKPHAPIEHFPGLPDPAPGPESSAVTTSGTRALENALAALPEEQRRCWVLRELGGQSYEDIAETLNISQATVRGRLARARTTLAREMEDWR